MEGYLILGIYFIIPAMSGWALLKLCIRNSIKNCDWYVSKQKNENYV